MNRCDRRFPVDPGFSIVRVNNVHHRAEEIALGVLTYRRTKVQAYPLIAIVYIGFGIAFDWEAPHYKKSRDHLQVWPTESASIWCRLEFGSLL